MNKYGLTSFPIASPKPPFFSTNLGIAINTVLGLPQASHQVGKDILGGITRSILSTALSVSPNKETISQINPKEDLGNFGAFILGDKPIKDLATRVAEAEISIKSSPFAQKLGLDKQALPLGFLGVVGSTALDITPFGAEENVAKSLLQETITEGVVKILSKMKVPEEILPKFAEYFAGANTLEMVQEGLVTLKSLLGIKKLSQAEKLFPEEIQKLSQSESQLTDLYNQATKQAPISVAEKLPQELGATLPLGSKLNPTPEISSTIPLSEPQQSVNKLIDAIKNAVPARAELTKLQSKELSKRTGAISGIFEQGKGQQGYYEALGKLKGGLVTPNQYEKLQIEHLNPQVLNELDVKNLFNQAQQSPYLLPFEKLNIQTALTKLLGGEIPQPKELSLLEQVYGKNLVDTVLSKRGFLPKFKEAILQIANMPRTIMSSFLDFSFGGRQGWFAAPTFRKEFYTAWKRQFALFGSDKAYQAALDVIKKDSDFLLAKEGKLAFTDIGRLMGEREERYASSWAERIPLIGEGVKATNRAYTGFANIQRFGMFKSMVKDSELAGFTPRKNTELLRSIGTFVNNATGRGSLGSLERAATSLNAFFFSPRLIASRLNLLNPIYYIKQPPPVRKQAIKSLIGFAGMITTILTAAKLAGLKVGSDSNSSDFAKIKIGNTRIDIAGGFQQYIRMASQLISGKYVSSTTGKQITLGEGYKPLTRLDILQRQVESKEAPVFSLITSLLKGQDFTGKPINIPKEVGKRFVPLIVGDIVDLAKDDPSLIPLGVLGVFGVGIQTYKNTNTKSTNRYGL